MSSIDQYTLDAYSSPGFGSSPVQSGVSMPSFKASGSAASGLSGAVKDIFAGLGDFAEAGQYREAVALAIQNKKFTEDATKVKKFQTEREIFKTVGQQQAAVATSGFAQGGTALDLLRDSHAQGALNLEMIQRQGLITEAGYQEQANAYNTMAKVADMAGTGSFISAGINAVSAVASIFA